MSTLTPTERRASSDVQRAGLGGVRAILPRQEQVDAVVRDLESQPRWTIRRKREYVEGREGAKHDGCRAVHLIVVKAGSIT